MRWECNGMVKIHSPQFRTEDSLHAHVARLLTVAIAPPGTLSASGAFWCSIEHRNARNRLEGALRKSRGVVAGIPDIQIGYQGRTYWIELKRHDGSRSKAQKALHPVLEACGQPVGLCRSPEEVFGFLKKHGVPVRAEVMA
ncbi:hypothetical protein [Gluconobacter oxydans]|uniref:VRR-NUC domain-containing protein n=2 Tax=Gluconobacter oxydans TaxID=442 RepID=A0A829WXZ6_GLUOY|nr:hypothetical protein [Gluconobacter oxydans]GEM17993.1 hypothetical protein NBRC3293_2490 [Gluconobacter oxydans NBRC 3293]